jgi:histone deacetylase 1/2
MDVVSAFLHADGVSDIFMEQPEDYHTPSATGTRLICKLDKALYGIREAPRA